MKNNGSFTPVISDCRKSRQTAEIYLLLCLAPFFDFYFYEMCHFFEKRFVYCFCRFQALPYHCTPTSLKSTNLPSFFGICGACRRFIDTLKKITGVLLPLFLSVIKGFALIFRLASDIYAKLFENIHINL